MSYVVLARKLRPQTFSDLIGQEVTAQTLRNAIQADRVAHAFLFTGSRGVGKTSAARILTKAINCLQPVEANPCNACENCVDIQNNTSPDVFEIDAASNRGIENIRELRENVKYAPAKCRYKVYIIDETHMLTLESFNALLKTLEEPPAHVKFILATTDPHKVPQTILSRCQRYDFLRVPLSQMADYLEKVVHNEGIQMSRNAIEMVCKRSIGGMRDALTAIDQLLSYGNENLADEDVAEILGVLDVRSQMRGLQSIFSKDTQGALEWFYQIQQRGYDLQSILSDLLKSIKTISILKSLDASKAKHLFQDLSQDEFQQYQGFAQEINLSELQQMFHILLELEERLRRSTHAQTCFEMALVQMASVQPILDLSKALKALKAGKGISFSPPVMKHQGKTVEQIATPGEKMEFSSIPSGKSRLAALVEQREAERVTPPAVPTEQVDASEPVASNLSESPPATPITAPVVQTQQAVPAAPAVSEPAPAVPATPQVDVPFEAIPSGSVEPPVAPIMSEPVAPVPSLPVVEEQPVSTEPVVSAPTLEVAPPPVEVVSPALEPVVATPAEEVLSVTPVATDQESALDHVLNTQEVSAMQWSGYIDLIRQTQPRLGSILKNAICLGIEGKELGIGFREGTFVHMISVDDYKQLSEHASSYFHLPLSIVVKSLEDEAHEGLVSISEQQQQVADEDKQRRYEQAKNDGQVQAILEEFPQSEILKIHV